MPIEYREESLYGGLRPAARYDLGRAPLLYGIAWFAIVLVTAFGFWLLDFQVDDSVQKTVGYPALLAGVVLIVRGTPNSRRSPEARVRREACWRGGLAGGMVAVLLLGAFVTAFQLHTWSDWLILGVFASLPVGFGLMLNTWFTIGRY